MATDPLEIPPFLKREKSATAAPTTLAAVPVSGLAELEAWADRINAAHQRATESIFETGALLIEAKAEVGHGNWLPLLDRLNFSRKWAERLMKITTNPNLSNTTRCRLPASLSALEELSRLDDESFAGALEDGTIRPDMDRGEVTQMREAKRRVERVEHLAEATKRASEELGETLYPVILADPPWQFEVRSEKGEDRSASNHYQTMPTAEICARLAPATDDAVLYLWATAPMLPDALQVMGAWGFTYKSHAVWVKSKAGLGFWFRGQHELLLVGTRGSMPLPEVVPSSLIEGATRRHSAKPSSAYQMIEAAYPELSKLEMFVRNSRPGWSKWGNEA